MKGAIVFALIFLVYGSVADELLMLIQVTRHGARSTVELTHRQNVSRAHWQIGEG